MKMPFWRVLSNNTSTNSVLHLSLREDNKRRGINNERARETVRFFEIVPPTVAVKATLIKSHQHGSLNKS